MAKIDLKGYLERSGEPGNREAAASRKYQEELFEGYVSMTEGGSSELRAGLLWEYWVGAPLTGPKGLRRKLGTVDLEYFGRAHLAHYFVRESPAFHGELNRM